MNTAAAIGKALGGKRIKNGFLCRCPVPGHGQGKGDRNPSLSVTDGECATLFKCWASCDVRDVIDALRRRGLFDGVAAPATRTARHERSDSVARIRAEYERRQHEKARWLWSQRQPIVGTIAEKYLRVKRRIICELPPTLAFLPAIRPGHHPALISAFAMPVEIEPGVLRAPRNVTAVHLTLLRADGSDKADAKPNKLTVASPGLAPIAVAPITDGLALCITEGIENALSVHQANGLGCWAAGCAGRLPKIAASMPDYIEACTIFADADQVGQDGAQELAQLLHERRMEVRIIKQGSTP